MVSQTWLSGPLLITGQTGANNNWQTTVSGWISPSHYIKYGDQPWRLAAASWSSLIMTSSDNQLLRPAAAAGAGLYQTTAAMIRSMDDLQTIDVHSDFFPQTFQALIFDKIQFNRNLGNFEDILKFFTKSLNYGLSEFWDIYFYFISGSKLFFHFLQNTDCWRGVRGLSMEPSPDPLPLYGTGLVVTRALDTPQTFSCYHLGLGHGDDDNIVMTLSLVITSDICHGGCHDDSFTR